MAFNLMSFQIAFNKWTRATEQIAHGDNEYEREQLIDTADKLAEPWQSEHPEDWQYMRELVEQWRTDPDRVRAQTVTAGNAARGRIEPDVDNFKYRQVRHMSYLQFFFDPVEQQKRDWQDMHTRRAELNGELMAARSDTEAEQIQVRIAELDDQTNWPDSWRECEAAVAADWQFWHGQSESASEHYMDILRTREAAAAQSRAGQEEDAEELEETPWGA